MIEISNCAAKTQPQLTLIQDKERKLKLNLEIRSADDVTIVHCYGRIVYRDEAVQLSEKIAGLLPYTRQLVLDLSGVEMMDSTGMRESRERPLSLHFSQFSGIGSAHTISAHAPQPYYSPWRWRRSGSH